MSDKKIIPKCKKGKTSYVSSEGRWLPCCSYPHLGKILEESIFYNDEYLIKNNTEFHNFHEKDSFKLWIDFTEQNYDKAYNICKLRCSIKSHELNKKNKNITWVMDEQSYITNKFQLMDFIQNNELEYDFDKFIKK